MQFFFSTLFSFFLLCLPLLSLGAPVSYRSRRDAPAPAPVPPTAPVVPPGTPIIGNPGDNGPAAPSSTDSSIPPASSSTPNGDGAPGGAPAGPPGGAPGGPPGGAPAGPSGYAVIDHYEGEDFLNRWDFYNQPDPTHGSVNYLDKAAATGKGLARVEGNVAVLSVDSTSQLPPGANRDSIRIESQKTYTGGLFIADFAAMPHGDTVWPAWWSVGPGWPSGGEIDVLEGANTGPTNQYALHTTEGCALDSSQSSTFKGAAGNLKCASGPDDNSGCQIRESDARTYGEGFNAAGGGVYAHLWNHEGIKIWHFARSEVPADITSKNPDPKSWGKPAAFYSAASCSIADHFHDHKLVINTTLCGDWAGSAFPGGKDKCLEAVANPATYTSPSWKINYISVYDKK